MGGRSVGACRKMRGDIHGALCTSDPGKAVAQNATVQIAVDHRPQIGTIKPIGPLKGLLIHLFKILKMILHTLRIVQPRDAAG